MIARLDMLLPFEFAVPEGEQFPIFSYEEDGYEIMIHPPSRTDQPINQSSPDEISINDKSALIVNGIRVYFKKVNFNREAADDYDPPLTLIEKTVNSFLLKFRFVAKASKIHPIRIQHTSWQITYLNDDESELEKVKGLVRARGTKASHFSWMALNNEIWKDIFELPKDDTGSQWENLILDAKDALPEIGPAIVLAFTALEVFISYVHSNLPEQSPIPKNLWDWITINDDRRKEPSIAEQFDILLKAAYGVSLKENISLWESFKNLKSARNSFVHEGVAKVGKSRISEEEANDLLNRASEIILYINDKLPEELQRTDFKHDIKVQVKKIIFP